MIYIVLILVFLSNAIKANEEYRAYTKGFVTALIAGATYIGYKQLTKPAVFSPTAENLNICTLVPETEQINLQGRSYTFEEYSKKITNHDIAGDDRIQLCIEGKLNYVHRYDHIKNSSHDTYFVYSRGLAIGSCQSGNKFLYPKKSNKNPQFALKQACKYIMNNFINGPCITFDYPAQINAFNFAQKLDQQCMKTAIEHATKELPEKKLVGIGLCVGADILLRTQLTQPFSALILESPLVSFKEAAKKMASSYVPFIPFGGYLVNVIFQATMRNYKPQEDNLIDTLNPESTQMPILILHLKNDKVVPDSNIFSLVKKIKELGNREDVYCLVIHDNKLIHSTLNRSKAAQFVSNAFLAKYQLPHNPELAKKGEELLQIAQKNTQVQSSDEWIIIENKQ
ncbi:MAG: hypothetical protein ACOYT8_03700 [Candidatus Dependentiae bacterium]